MFPEGGQESPSNASYRSTARRSATYSAAATGILLGLSFPPFPFPFLAWGALVPLLYAWRRATDARSGLLYAWGAWMLAVALAFSWPLLHVLPRTALHSATALLLLPLWMAVPFALAVPLRRRLGEAAGLTALAAFYLMAEWSLQHGPLALPWLLLGHTQAAHLPFNQLAALAGVPGLSLWVLLLNLGGFALLTASRARTRWRWAALLLLLVTAAFGYGRWRAEHLPAPERHVTALLVQPALPPTAWADVHDAARVDTLLARTTAALDTLPRPPDLVIWPETALPVLPAATARRRLYGRLQAWADGHGTALLTGAVTRAAPAAPAAFAYHNAALLFRPAGPPAAYAKRRLVPFAEGVPFAAALPWLHRLAVPAGGVAGYLPGDEAGLMQLDTTSFGVLICFESLFGEAVRPYAARAAGFLVALTQDGWWGPSAGYRQHLAFTRLRAIETQRALVQVAVTGTTALLLPDGTSSFETAWMQPAVRLAQVPVYTGTTPYARYGDLVSLFALLPALLLGLRYAAARLRARAATG